ncbi:hypothetical protein K438DRAFT_1767724 [Mycena galopus ATCC 62051]|nr:hypothetical protein K438DRAFT_1767724 [Mycena galopus ATCC 62051]
MIWLLIAKIEKVCQDTARYGRYHLLSQTPCLPPYKPDTVPTTIEARNSETQLLHTCSFVLNSPDKLTSSLKLHQLRSHIVLCASLYGKVGSWTAKSEHSEFANRKVKEQLNPQFSLHAGETDYVYGM